MLVIEGEFVGILLVFSWLNSELFMRLHGQAGIKRLSFIKASPHLAKGLYLPNGAIHTEYNLSK